MVSHLFEKIDSIFEARLKTLDSIADLKLSKSSASALVTSKARRRVRFMNKIIIKLRL